MVNLRRDTRKVDLKNAFAKFAEVVYVDYQPKNPTVYAPGGKVLDAGTCCLFARVLMMGWHARERNIMGGSMRTNTLG